MDLTDKVDEQYAVIDGTRDQVRNLIQEYKTTKYRFRHHIFLNTEVQIPNKNIEDNDLSTIIHVAREYIAHKSNLICSEIFNDDMLQIYTLSLEKVLDYFPENINENMPGTINMKSALQIEDYLFNQSLILDKTLRDYVTIGN